MLPSKKTLLVLLSSLLPRLFGCLIACLMLSSDARDLMSPLPLLLSRTHLVLFFLLLLLLLLLGLICMCILISFFSRHSTLGWAFSLHLPSSSLIFFLAEVGTSPRVCLSVRPSQIYSIALFLSSLFFLATYY